MKIDYCYHTHTKRCGHAIGEDEEYVLAALNAGITRMGFSDHVMLEGIHQPKVRGDFSLLEDYLSSVHSLQMKYKDRIDIKLGFECEYADYLLPYYRWLKENKKADYLLLGQHCSFTQDHETIYYFPLKDHPDGIKTYVDDLINGMRSGLFLYVCHPDLYVTAKERWDEECEKAVHQICQVAVECHLPLELNVNGRYWKDRGTLKYSCEEFWKVVSQYPIDVVIGYDAHNPDHFSRTLDFFEELVNKYHLHLLNLNLSKI